MGKLGWMVVVASVSMLSMVGCAADTEGDEEVADETTDALLAGRKIPEREVAQILRDAGFPDEQIGKMVCTAKWESSFFERASNKRNRNGSIDRGLFQINSVHLGAWSCPRNGELLYTAKTNADCAYDIWKAQGNRAWYGYRSHKTECDSYSVDE